MEINKISKSIENPSKDFPKLFEGISDNVLIMSERDRAGYEYLVKIRGRGAVEMAVNHLAGKRKPYVSNIAKLMCVTIPTTIQREELPVSDEVANNFLEQMKKMLSEGGLNK